MYGANFLKQGVKSMRLVNAKHSKALLALVLVMLLMVSMLPLFNYQASAAVKYYSATGVVTDATMNTITILKSGRYRTFGKSDAKILHAPDGIALRDTVKIVYREDNPQDAVQIVMVSHSTSQNRVPHNTHELKIVTGVITDATMNAVTINTGAETMTFGKEDAHLLNARDGLLLGDRVRITYYEDNASEAVQIYMIEHGRRHRTYDYNAPDTNCVFYGDILAVGEDYFVCQDMQTGIVVTFFYDSTHYEGPDLEVSDSVRVLYNDQYPSIAMRVLMVNDMANYY